MPFNFVLLWERGERRRTYFAVFYISLCVSTYIVCMCTCASGCVLFLYASQLHMVPAFPDLSEAFRRSSIQDLTAGIVPS